MEAGDLLGGSGRIHREDDGVSGLGGCSGVVRRDEILAIF